MIEIMVITVMAVGLGGVVLGFAIPWFRVGLPAQALATDVLAIQHQAERYHDRHQVYRRMALPGESRDSQQGYAAGTSTLILPRAVSSGALSSRFTCADDCAANPLGAQYSQVVLDWRFSIVVEIRLPADSAGSRRQPVLDRLRFMLENRADGKMLACRKEDGADSLLYVRMMPDQAAAEDVRGKYDGIITYSAEELARRMRHRTRLLANSWYLNEYGGEEGLLAQMDEWPNTRLVPPALALFGSSTQCDPKWKQ